MILRTGETNEENSQEFHGPTKKSLCKRFGLLLSLEQAAMYAVNIMPSKYTYTPVTVEGFLPLSAATTTTMQCEAVHSYKGW